MRHNNIGAEIVAAIVRNRYRHGDTPAKAKKQAPIAIDGEKLH
jgi:hypothetical protein